MLVSELRELFYAFIRRREDYVTRFMWLVALRPRKY